MEDLVGCRTAADLGGRAGLVSDANHTAAKLSGGSGSGRRQWRRIWVGMQGFGGRETLGFGLDSREWYLGLKVLARTGLFLFQFPANEPFLVFS
jgi:hypothetical protein